jgi:hypothetical protein
LIRPVIGLRRAGINGRHRAGYLLGIERDSHGAAVERYDVRALTECREDASPSAAVPGKRDRNQGEMSCGLHRV